MLLEMLSEEMGTDDAVEVPGVPEVATEAPEVPAGLAGKVVDMIWGKCDYICKVMTERG